MANWNAALLALPINDPAWNCALFKDPSALSCSYKLASAIVKIKELAKRPAVAGRGHCLREHALEACHLDGLQNEEISATSLKLAPMVAWSGRDADSGAGNGARPMSARLRLARCRARASAHHWSGVAELHRWLQDGAIGCITHTSVARIPCSF